VVRLGWEKEGDGSLKMTQVWWEDRGEQGDLRMDFGVGERWRKGWVSIRRKGGLFETVNRNHFLAGSHLEKEGVR
jgi:hypothetical protein